MRRPDGRIVERVRLPAQLIDDVAREAKRRGQPFEDVAGDLVAEALPEALREAAEALLAAGRESLKRNAHGPTPLAASFVCNLGTERSGSRCGRNPPPR